MRVYFFYPNILILPVLVLAVALLAGCSATQQISDNATGVYDNSQANITSAKTIQTNIATAKDKGVSQTARPFLTKASNQAGQIITRSQDTQSKIKDVLHNLTKVKDITPWWANLLKWLAIGAAVVGLIVVLIMSGALPAVRAAFGWITSFIPSHQTHQAALDAAADVAGTLTPQQRESIAAARTSPTYSAAYKRAKKKQQEI